MHSRDLDAQTLSDFPGFKIYFTNRLTAERFDGKKTFDGNFSLFKWNSSEVVISQENCLFLVSLNNLIFIEDFREIIVRLFRAKETLDGFLFRLKIIAGCEMFL